MDFEVIVLAAGAGTRMKGNTAKVAHELLGKPLVRWVVDAAQAAGAASVCTVVGHGREQVEPLVADTVVALQPNRLGTGDAVRCALAGVAAQGGGSAGAAAAVLSPDVVVLNGDTPLITPETIRSLVALRAEQGAAACVLSFTASDPAGYGRIVRDPAGAVERIVEEKDAAPAELGITEVNGGAYCFSAEALTRALAQLQNTNAQGEYYLTDCIGILRAAGERVLAHCVDDASELAGVNTRVQLAELTRLAQQRINRAHMLAGVTMLDPSTVWIGPDVRLEPDVQLLPLTMLFGDTSIAAGSVVGPNTRIIDSTVGRYCIVDDSVVLGSTLENDVNVGPRAYLRPGTSMLAGSKAGTHVEIKASTIGPGSKVPHLSYIGDATLGADVNIGAGSITCNFDGATKNHTDIGSRAFVGSDTMFVAPVNVGEGAVTGAGSVITHDVPAGALAVERNEQRTIPGYAARRHKQ